MTDETNETQVLITNVHADANVSKLIQQINQIIGKGQQIARIGVNRDVSSRPIPVLYVIQKNFGTPSDQEDVNLTDNPISPYGVEPTGPTIKPEYDPARDVVLKSENPDPPTDSIPLKLTDGGIAFMQQNSESSPTEPPFIFTEHELARAICEAKFRRQQKQQKPSEDDDEELNK